MENKVYYGEYSLTHWINLILKKKIILPKYQRAYVWEEEGVKKLIESLRNKQFVPPVTIGSFYDDKGKRVDYILDGQQRLTSILLSFLGLFPNKECLDWKPKDPETYATSDDYNDDIDEGEEIDNPEIQVIEWTFRKLIELVADEKIRDINQIKSRIREKITDEQYKKTDSTVDDEFLKGTYLGFCYLVPSYSDTEHFKKEQINFYSTLFRNINNLGTKLSVQESRRSLYFLDDQLEPYFDPSFLSSMSISRGKKIDFVRFLALLEDYKNKGENINKVALGYGTMLEGFYEKYVYSISENNKHIFNKESFDNLKDSLEKLGINTKKFDSIIDLDLYLFGLIYFIVFDRKTINIQHINELRMKIDEKIDLLKKQDSNEGNTVYQSSIHLKSPNKLKYIRYRLKLSIDIYKDFLNE